jgi:hypothetical protein
MAMIVMFLAPDVKWFERWREFADGNGIRGV